MIYTQAGSSIYDTQAGSSSWWSVVPRQALRAGMWYKAKSSFCFRRQVNLSTVRRTVKDHMKFKDEKKKV